MAPHLRIDFEVTLEVLHISRFNVQRQPSRYCEKDRGYTFAVILWGTYILSIVLGYCQEKGAAALQGAPKNADIICFRGKADNNVNKVSKIER